MVTALVISFVIGHVAHVGQRSVTLSAFQVRRARARASCLTQCRRCAGRPDITRLTEPRLPSCRACRGGQCALRALLQPRAAVSMLTSNDFKVGMTIESDSQPYKVIEFLHVKPGKGAAFVRSKLKNLITGNTMEKTWRAGESVGAADVQKFDVQYTYQEGDQYVFMDMESFEEMRIDAKAIDQIEFLKESCSAQVAKWNGQIISVDLPAQMDLKVTETMPGVKGNTVQGGSKPATLETGAVIQVPLFIDEGEVVRVDTIEKKYLSRASKQ